MSEARRRLERSVPLALAAAGILAAGAAQGQTMRTLTSARQVWDTKPISVELRYGAGHLEVRPAEPRTLYRMELHYDEEVFSPVSTFDESARVLRLGAARREGVHDIDVDKGARAIIALTRQVPLDLDVEFGAGDAELELGGMSLSRLDVSTGASETTIRFSEPNPVAAEVVEIEAGAADLKVYGLGNARAGRIAFQGGVGSTILDFGGAWSHDASASVEMGIGSVVLRFPRGLGVRIEKDSFLTSFNVEDMVRRGDSYVSRNWEGARHRLTVEVDAAFGSIDVDWTD